ncbi:lytic murein transglycosylase [Proteus vulgaris]|uniref:Lytic murein transglycosylase n=1 Tax=Proteus vulgaris TaxID=585 RepID=A0A6G6SHL4_PROVU|nr:lytic murein transglycosylase [Proteus vulgaris]QIF94208.1 lytic murein transglycosylase [Proteus vulgaris]WIF74181.1 lytic murein transglycosylase [Proteus vulgaris]CRL59706.1 Membrane-bound lytic murein transglycosylase B precursor [Proteus vulgaris]
MFKYSFIAVIVSGLMLSACTNSQQKLAERQIIAPEATAVETQKTPRWKQVNIASLEQAFPKDARTAAQFPAYVEALKLKAAQLGYKQETIDFAFSEAHFIERVIKSDRNQPEKKITLDVYLPRIVTNGRLNQGANLYQENQSTLELISKKYGVPANYIVALWGLESGFGKVQGKEDVVSALATLAFEGRREELFTRQLMAALEIIEEGHLPQGQRLKGSWAGAMGQTQFMPSSFLTYAADGNGDGKIDIWNTREDAFASAANYLATEGWKSGLPWGEQVTLSVDFNQQLEGIKAEQQKTVAQWKALGVQLPANSQLSDDMQVWLIIPDDDLNRSYLVTQNFRTIMHWNSSYFFALSIVTMADGVANKINSLPNAS